MRLAAGGVLLIAVLGAGSDAVQAGSIGVGPTRIELDGRARVQTLTVQNTGEAATLLQVDVYRWRQSDEGDELTPTPEIAITPRVFEVQPGESRAVRVGLRDPRPVAAESAYRVYVREVQSADAGSGTRLQYLMQIGIPAFVNPADPAAASRIAWMLEADHTGCARLKLVNSGNRRERVLAVHYQENGKTLWRSDVPQYVLAGSQRVMATAPCMDSTQAGQAELVVDTESGEQRAARIHPGG